MTTTKLEPGPPPMHDPQGIYSLGELARPALHAMVGRSAELFADPGAHARPLEHRQVGMLFTRSSTRTRTAFTSGVLRLGGAPVSYGPHDLQTASGESLADTGAILGMMLDLLVVRTAGPVAELRELSAHGGIPVINAMAAEEHPTQGICDLATIAMARGCVDGTRLLYIGEGNNTAVALAHGLSAYPGCEVTFVTPPGYGLPPGVLARAAQRGAASGTSLAEFHSMTRLPHAVDIVYTTRWQTTGTTKPDAGWRETFRPFFVNAALLARWPGALFMHDLPACRGEEVAAEVLDGPASIAWPQARMKLASAMAALEWAAAILPA
ncbi:MAG TPA: ornithine carbamoyltransferase [Streptosporangiaceae bacterium]